MDNPLPKRRHPRLKAFDYGSAGAYFITICTANKRCLLSRVVGRGLGPAEIQYTRFGAIAQKQLFLLGKRFPHVHIDHYVIMPNHIHILMSLESDAAGASPRPTVTDIVCAYKSLTTLACKRIRPINKVFQTSFFEHIVRGERDYEEIAQYINENPSKWELDKLYMEQ